MTSGRVVSKTLNLTVQGLGNQTNEGNMTEQNEYEVLIISSKRKHGFRRCGFAFTREARELDCRRLTETEVNILKSEPALLVSAERRAVTDGASGDGNGGSPTSPSSPQGEPPAPPAGFTEVNGTGKPLTEENVTEVTDELKKRIAIKAAWLSLDQAQTDKFTAGGEPKLEVLSELVGDKVTSEERKAVAAMIEAEEAANKASEQA